jgi:hypothetical protein
MPAAKLQQSRGRAARPLAAGRDQPVAFGSWRTRHQRRDAAGGTRWGLMLERPARRAGCPALLTPGSRGVARSAPCGRCARTDAASQCTKRADARRPWRCAARRSRNRPQRVPPAARHGGWRAMEFARVVQARGECSGRLGAPMSRERDHEPSVAFVGGLGRASGHRVRSLRGGPLRSRYRPRADARTDLSTGSQRLWIAALARRTAARAATGRRTDRAASRRRMTTSSVAVHQQSSYAHGP